MSYLPPDIRPINSGLFNLTKMNFFKSLTHVYKDIIILGLILLGFVSLVLLTVYLIHSTYYL